MNSENSKTSKPYVLILKFTDTLDKEEVKRVLHMEKHKKLIQ